MLSPTTSDKSRAETKRPMTDSSANTSSKKAKKAEGAKSKNPKDLPTKTFFKKLSGLPNEILFKILKDVYPSKAFYNHKVFSTFDAYEDDHWRNATKYGPRYKTRNWNLLVKADRHMILLSRVSETIRENAELVLRDLAIATDDEAGRMPVGKWFDMITTHRLQKEYVRRLSAADF